MARVLIVEDDFNLREIYTEILTMHGHEVQTAADFLSAETALSQASYHAIISDLMIEHMTIEALLQFFERHRARGVGIAIISGRADLRTYFEKHGLLFMPKPVSGQDLNDIMSQLLDGQR